MSFSSSHFTRTTIARPVASSNSTTGQATKNADVPVSQREHVQLHTLLPNSFSQSNSRNITFTFLLEPDAAALISKTIPGKAGVCAVQVLCRHLLNDDCSSDLDLFIQLCWIYQWSGSANELQLFLKTLDLTFAERLTPYVQFGVESFCPCFRQSRCATADLVQNPSLGGNALCIAQCETDLR